MFQIPKYKGFFIPHVYVEDDDGVAHVSVDINNRFTYVRPEFRNKVVKAFQKKFGDRKVNNEQDLEDIKKEVKEFLFSCLRRGLIIEDKQFDNIYNNRTEEGIKFN